LKIKKSFSVYFESKPEQQGTFQWNMHEWMSVNVHFNTCYKQVTPQDDLWSMARMKKQNESEKKVKNENKELAKLKTRKGGLDKMSTPLIDNLWRQIRQKWGNEKNLFPGESKTRKGGSGKSGVWKWKNEILKSIDHRCEHPMFTQHWHA
jgi:hypothetical protein